MGLASLGPIAFRIDPNEVTWGYRLNTKEQETYGGKVVQILSCSVDTMTIKGEIGKTGFSGLMTLANQLQSIMDYHVNTQQPVTFTYAPRAWQAQVFVTGFPQIQDRVGEISWPYQITLEVFQGFDNVQKSIMIEALLNMVDGINWHQKDLDGILNKYNYLDPSSNDWDNAWQNVLAQFPDDAGVVNDAKQAAKDSVGNTPASGFSDNNKSDSKSKGGFTFDPSKGLMGQPDISLGGK